MIKRLIPLALAATLAGCALGQTVPEIPDDPSPEWVRENLPVYQAEMERWPSKENKAAVAELQRYADYQGRAEAKMRRVDRELTLAWDNMGRGGAAMRQPAYVHVLGESFNDRYADIAQLAEQSGTDEDTIRDALARLHDASREDRPWQVGYSVYEMERWKRFCDGGKGMDEPDWQFVTQAGGISGVPADYARDCRPPAHDYGDYLRAWTRFCEADGPSRADRDIVRDSVRPRTVVNPCRALQTP